MKIAIIGAGITGLTTALELSKKGHAVTVYERSSVPGGLGTYIHVGNNSIERFYHHFFQSDLHVIKLIKELGIGNKLKFYPSKTSIYSGDTIYPFSGPADLLRFTPLSFIERIRLGMMLAYLKYWSFNLDPLDVISASDFIKRTAGTNVYKKIWEPLLVGKFAKYAQKIPALWLRWRIADRTFKLGYLDGGAQTLFDTLLKELQKYKVTVHLNTGVNSVKSSGKKVILTTDAGPETFDRCVITAVSPIASMLIKNKLPESVRKNLETQDQLGAVCVLLELKQSVQSEYWINICDLKQPVLVAVEHTNLISPSHYGGKSLVYLANYIHRDEKRFSLSDREIIDSYSSFLKKLNPAFDKSWIIKAHVSRVPRAQTIFATGASHTRPPITLPVPHIYLANIDQMYPHDRNFNLGVELGKKVAGIITECYNE